MRTEYESVLRREVHRLRAWLRLIEATTDHDNAYYALHGYDAPSDNFIATERVHPPGTHPVELRGENEEAEESAANERRDYQPMWLVWAGDNAERPLSRDRAVLIHGFTRSQMMKRAWDWHSQLPLASGKLQTRRATFYDLSRYDELVP